MYRKYRIVESIASSVSQYESYRDQVYRYTPSYVLFQSLQCSLQWRHNERDGIWNHLSHACLLNRLLKVQIKEKHQSSTSLAFVRGIHRGPVNSPHKGPVTWNMLPFDDAIMCMQYMYHVILGPVISVIKQHQTVLDVLSVWEQHKHVVFYDSLMAVNPSLPVPMFAALTNLHIWQ